MNARRKIAALSVTTLMRIALAVTLWCVMMTGLGGLYSSARAATYASIILNADTGDVLYERNPDTRTYPASLTKMMTLYLLFDALESGKVTMATSMTVSDHAAAQAPSKLGLPAGRSITVEQAIKALVVKSANDIAVVVAEHLGGSEPAFAQMMTSMARKLGMPHTTFRNASGLPDLGQMTTARDLSTLAIALKRDHPRYYKYFATREFRYGGAVIRTHNRFMLNYAGADGLKTGYIQASGFNLTASATRQGTTLVGVVLGGKTSGWRDQHMAKLMDLGFNESGKASAPAMAQRKIGRAVASAQAFAPSDPPPPPPAPSRRSAPARAEQDQTPLTSTPKAIAEISGWGVQVGAFSAFDSADSTAKKAAKTLSVAGKKGHSAVASASTRSGTVYRARVVGLADEKAARGACTVLRNKNIPGCIVLPPAQARVAENAEPEQPQKRRARQ